MNNQQYSNQWTEAVRQACVQAAQAAYEDARMSGLCHESAWECAVDAIRALDLNRVVDLHTATENNAYG
ncbi:MAG: acetyltransferase [Anaerolineales bacterium]|nr:acetyltransferase [Anaerolineales bacterium]